MTQKWWMQEEESSISAKQDVRLFKAGREPIGPEIIR
jgi:hypothetical protein